MATVTINLTVGLPGVLTNDNTTGANNIVITAGQQIIDSSSDAFLMFDSGDVNLYSDSTHAFPSGLYMSDGEIELSTNNGVDGVFCTSNGAEVNIISTTGKVQIKTVTEILMQSEQITFKDDSSNFEAQINMNLLTANRVQQIPDKGGTFAMLSDITAHDGNIYTKDGTIADAERIVTLNGETINDKIVFTNGTDIILTIKGNGEVFSRGANNLTTNTAYGECALDGSVSGSLNTAFGQEALTTLSTSSGNTAVGYRALYLVTGKENTAIGGNAGKSITAGQRNVAIGYSALQNGSGSNNMAFGYFSMGEMTTGANNVAIGSNSGRSISGGVIPNETGDNSVFIGADTRPLADNDQYEIVIGVGMTGKGSNTTSIGTSATKGTFLYGAVMIGEYTVATLPTASTYQAGMVMVTDETGGYTQAFSDGTNWRRVQDRAIVS